MYLYISVFLVGILVRAALNFELNRTFSDSIEHFCIFRLNLSSPGLLEKQPARSVERKFTPFLHYISDKKLKTSNNCGFPFFLDFSPF